jgi:hypothetical protein
MLDEETKAWLEEQARLLERSASWLLRAIIADYRARLESAVEAAESKEKERVAQ